jgi:hypothetical protein
MSKVKATVKARLEYLRRLSVVWASPLRLKIVTELSLREMSPKQFYTEFGGGSISRVDKTFKLLAKHGWLRYVHSKGPGGARRGAKEHFYRSTALAVFDDATWELVPYSMRIAISWATFKQLAERVRHALQAKTLTAREGTHLGCTTVALDQRGWARVVEALAALFASVFEEQEEAKIRLARSREAPMLATLGLAAFESAIQGHDGERGRAAPHLEQLPKDCPVPFTLRVSKAIADELCLKILEVANRRKISAPEFHAEFGGDTVDGIRRRFKMLERVGWLTRVGTKTGGRRRSAVELFYRATAPAILDREDWAEALPSAGPAPAAWTTFVRFAEAVKDAIATGTFESRLDNHFSWSLLLLDMEGWGKVATAVDALFALIFSEWEAAETRIAESGEQPIMTTIALAAFESPRAEAKEP